MNNQVGHLKPNCVTYGQTMSARTYYGIGGTAEYFAEPRSLLELLQCTQWAQQNGLPIALFGAGSNSLLADGPFSGLVVTLSQLTNSYWETPELLYVEAGVSNTEIAEICWDAGRAGAAWMYRMPGQLGATVRMNARCYGGEISQIAEQIFTLDLHGRLRIHEGRDVFYGYKKTLLMDQPEIVVAARLRLSQTSTRADILTLMQSCEADRHRKHHFEHPSCGSTFKNNYAVGRPSGQIFDECGLKGTRLGRSEVSQYHANFVWNLGGTTARDMLSLAAHMRERALTLTQSDLELEVQPIGLFSEQIFQACAMEKLGPAIKSDTSRWVGLLWHPESTALSKRATQFPHVLMHSPFHHYFRTPGRGYPLLAVKLTQLLSLADAQQQPTRPFIRWETLCSESSSAAPVATEEEKIATTLQNFFPVRPPSAPDFLNELWNYSVSEIFIAHGNSLRTEYLEFEMTPEGHWVALAFDDHRKRKKEHEIPQKSLWPLLDFHLEKNSMSLSFSYELLSSLIYNSELRIQACLNLGGDGWYLAPHWAPTGSEECWDMQEEPHVKPDFHQAKRYWRLFLR